MTQKETMKVWTDLSARVMYHPKIRVTNTYLNQTYDDVLTMANFTQYAEVKYEVKPYLRPMNSMTEYEFAEIKCRWVFIEKCHDENDLMDVINRGMIEVCDAYSFIGWLNEHGFDYSGLIHMGLAFDQKEEICKTV